MSALSDVDNVVFRDVDADGDVRDDPQWRALLGHGRKRRRRVKHLPGQHNQESHGNDHHGVDVPHVLDKLKLGKLAPAGFTVRSSKKIRTDYADVGVAEVDGPDGPQVRVGIISGERGRWDAGFTGEARKAELRKQIAEKRAVFDSDDDAPADIEDQIEELESELEDLESARTAVLTPAAMADFRRQLGEGLDVAKANKVKQDAVVKETEALDEQRDALTAEFSDPELERKISKTSWELRNAQNTVKSLENGPNPPHWTPEYIADRIASWKADVAKYEAELAPLLARRAEIMPPDARARLEDLDRQYFAYFDEDITDMITSAEVSAPNGARLRAEIWGSDDIDEQWVSTRLFVLAPGETTADVTDYGDEYGGFPGLKGLTKLIAGIESGADAKSAPPRARAKHLPGRHNQEDHGHHGHGGIDDFGPMMGLKVLDGDEYTRLYGDVLDERTVSSADDVDLSVRVFHNGDAHIVLDLPRGRHQVMSDFDGPDSMRALAGDIRTAQRADISDSSGSGEVAFDTDSNIHDYYVAKDDLGNIWLRTSDQAEDDYLELSDQEADDLADALDDLADTHEEEFPDVEVVGGKSRKHLPGLHDQRDHGRRGPRIPKPPKVPDVVPQPTTVDVAAPKPRRAPKPPKPKPSSRRDVANGDFSGLKRVGDQQGSNPAGLYEAGDGSKWYVKQQKSIDHARNEALAGALYREALGQGPEVHVGKGAPGLDGPQTASKWIDTRGPIDLDDPNQINAARQGFATDAWLANWDVVGMSFDNIEIDENGRPVRVDPGGSLRYRAQGEPKGKAFGDKATEWDTLRDPAKAPQAAAVFGGMTPQQLAESAKAVEGVSPERIRELVAAHDLDGGLADKLISRREDILGHIGPGHANHGGPPAERFRDAARGYEVLRATDLNADTEGDLLSGDGNFPGSSLPRRAVRDALDSYGVNGYAQINADLRRTKGAELSDDAVGIDAAMAGSRLDRDVVVNRGMVNPSKIFGMALPDDMTGLTWIDHAYVSTTVEGESALGFSGFKGLDMRILVPAGTPAISSADLLDPEEVLLGRGLTFRVVADHGSSDGPRRVDVEVVQ